MQPPRMALRRINGPAVRAIRMALGISLTDMAHRLGVSVGYLSNIEKGRKQPASPTTARLAHELGVAVDAITFPACGCTENAA